MQKIDYDVMVQNPTPVSSVEKATDEGITIIVSSTSPAPFQGFSMQQEWEARY